MKLFTWLVLALAIAGCSNPGRAPMFVPRADIQTIPIGEYVVIEENDVSYARVRRHSAHIRISYENSPEQVEAILKTAATAFQQAKRAKAVAVFAVGPDETLDGGATAGIANYAPGGVWADAHLDRPLEFDIELGDPFFDEASRRSTFVPGRTYTIRSDMDAPAELHSGSFGPTRVVSTLESGTEVMLLDEFKLATLGEYVIRYRVRPTSGGTAGWISSKAIQP